MLVRARRFALPPWESFPKIAASLSSGNLGLVLGIVAGVENDWRSPGDSIALVCTGGYRCGYFWWRSNCA